MNPADDLTKPTCGRERTRGSLPSKGLHVSALPEPRRQTLSPAANTGRGEKLSGKRPVRRHLGRRKWCLFEGVVVSRFHAKVGRPFERQSHDLSPSPHSAGRQPLDEWPWSATRAAIEPVDAMPSTGGHVLPWVASIPLVPCMHAQMMAGRLRIAGRGPTGAGREASSPHAGSKTRVLYS